jgi:16S rRNA (cytosine967-C5)-methyltransferase
MKNSRLIAFEILCDVLKNDAYSNIAIDKALRSVESDKAFVSSLVYGVIERKITLDYIINPYLKGKTKPKVKIILYIGAYQIYFMDKVPNHASINESVQLAKNVGCAYYSKLINAVLHKIDDNLIDIDLLDDLSIKYSCPQHLINMLTKAYGEQNTLSFLQSINQKPPVFAVPNHLYVDTDECLYELNNCGIEGEIVDNAIMLTSAFDLSKCKPFDDGLFHIEDLSSFNCANALDVGENQIVIDVCSAPGGKAFTIAENMNNTGKLYAFDLYEHRVNLIKNGAKRLGITNIEASVNDALVFNSALPMADRVLCDVPCSGFGIVRRKPEIRYKNLDSIKNLPDIQYSILSVSAKYLKVGGKLVYSTCTLNKRENENVVAKFLQFDSSFKLLSEKTIFPSNNGGDGFYYAVLERIDD